MFSLIVTHKSPDLDAICSTWLLKTFLSEDYSAAKIHFVLPGQEISDAELEELKTDRSKVVHVDTGLGKFDHHQEDRAQQRLSASSLVYEHICETQKDKKENQALKTLIEFVTSIDHFEEVNWPNADSEQYSFMLHEIIHGLEHLEYHDDDSMMHFGFTCLDSVYQVLKNHLKAKEILESRAQTFMINNWKCLYVDTNSDDVLKIAQKRGYDLVMRKDPDQGNVRIKARPDSDINLRDLYHKIISVDTEGSWYFHQSGKMLLNGSRKSQQHPSPLTLEEIKTFLIQIYEK